MIRIKPDGTVEFDSVDEALAFQAKNLANRAGAVAALSPQPALSERREVSLAVRRLPKGCVTPNGRGHRWQFTYQGLRYSGPTVTTKQEAQAGLNEVLKVLGDTGDVPEPEPAGPVPGAPYGIEMWRDVHKFDKRMAASLEELESWRTHFDVLPAAMRQAVEARLSGLYPHQIAEQLGKAPATIWQAICDAKTKLRAAARAAIAEPPQRVGAPFRGGGIKKMPGNKFRWCFTFEGKVFYGPVVATFEEAERQRLEAIESVNRGVPPTAGGPAADPRPLVAAALAPIAAPPVPPAPEVKPAKYFLHRWASTDEPVAFLKCERCGMEHTIGSRLGPGYRDRVWYRFAGDPVGGWIMAGPTGQKPHCTGDRQPSEAASSVKTTPFVNHSAVCQADPGLSTEADAKAPPTQNIVAAAAPVPPDARVDAPLFDDGFVHRWVSEGGGTAHCSSAGHVGRLTRAADAVTCPACADLGEPNEERPREEPPPAWVMAWLKPAQREAFQAVVLEGVHCRTVAHLAEVSPNVIAGRANSARDTVRRLLKWEAERAAEGIPLTADDRLPPRRGSTDPLLSILAAPQPTEEPPRRQDDPPSVPVESGQPAPSSKNPCRVCGELGHDGRRHRFDRTESLGKAPATARVPTPVAATVADATSDADPPRLDDPSRGAGSPPDRVGAELTSLAPWFPALRGNQRQAVELRASGVRAAVIAERLQISRKSADNAISIGRAKLRVLRDRGSRPGEGPPPGRKRGRQGRSEAELAVPAEWTDEGDRPQAASSAFATESSLVPYFREMSAHSLLTKEEEIDLATRYQATGDKAALDKLVTSNLRFVVMVAKKLRRPQHRLEDLIQEGNIGLIRAAEKFDPSRGCRFGTYAMNWIRSKMFGYIVATDRLIIRKHSNEGDRMFWGLKKATRKLSRDGHEPTIAELAKELRVTEEQLDTFIAWQRPEVSLDAPVAWHDGTDGAAIGDLIADERAASPDASADDLEFTGNLKARMREFEKTLDARDLDIFRSRLVAADPQTLEEIGHRHEIGRERVRQIESDIKGCLRDYLLRTMDRASLPIGPENAERATG
jgi:RNA polymerase sigma factor (sigma-70 family)